MVNNGTTFHGLYLVCIRGMDFLDFVGAVFLKDFEDIKTNLTSININIQGTVCIRVCKLNCDRPLKN